MGSMQFYNVLYDINTSNPKGYKNIKETCEVCHDQFFTKINFVVHKLNCPRRNFKCDICGNMFRDRCSFFRHYETHFASRQRLFDCKKCKLKFYGIEALKGHESSVHNNKRPHPCKYCPKTFKRGFQRNRHMMSLHNNNLGLRNLFNCELCNKSYCKRDRLRVHEESHMK